MIAWVLLPIILLCWAAIGLRLLRLLGAEPSEAGDALHAGLSVGMVVCGLVAELLAVIGMLRPGPLALAGGVSLLLGWSPLRETIARVRWRLDARTMLWLGPALIGLVVVLISYATPPIGGDQTKYQLAYPRMYARAGGLVESTSVWGHQQFAQNFVYAVGYTLGSELLARVMAVVTGVLTAIAFGRLVERHLLPGAGLAGGVLFFTLPICWSQMARAGVDTPVTLFALLAVSALLDWRHDGQVGGLWRSAMMCGCAAACKVFGLLVPALVGLGVLYELGRRVEGVGVSVGRAIGFGAVVLAVCVPFYVRNVVETGNPIYPFGYGALGGKDWSTEASDYLDLYFTQYQNLYAAKRDGVPYRGLAALKFPWDVTMYPESFERSARQTLDVGPFALAFLPAIVILQARRAQGWITALIGAAFVAIVTATAWPHPRYVLPGFALCMSVAMAGAAGLLGRRGLLAMVLFTVVGNLALTAKLLTMWPDQVRVLTGRLSVNAFMDKYSPRSTFWRAANPVIGPTGKVLVLEKIIHPYDIDVPFVMASFLEQGWLNYRQMSAGAQLAAVGRQLQITHVAVDTSTLTAAGDPFEAHVARLWTDFVTTECEPVLDRPGYRLYTLRSAGTACRETEGRRG